MSKNVLVAGLFVALLVSSVAGVPDANADPYYYPWYQGLSCSPSAQWVQSGEYATFTAYSEYQTQIWPERELTWSALGGHPSTGTGWTFKTRFNTDSLNETRVVTVTDGYRTASCTVYVYGDEPSRTPTPALRCSPSTTTVDSGERVTFTARGGTREYSWSAPDGSPSYGDDDSFRSRFTNDSWYDQYRYVTVSSGWQTATCTVTVRPSYRTPTPTPYDTLRCSSDVSAIDSGERVTFTARGGDSEYRWYAADGDPSSGDDRAFRTRFYNYGYYPEYRSATVTSGWQSETCLVTVNGSARWTPYPTPYPTVYPTPYPTSTTYPSVDARLELSQTGRNVTRGQSGEYTALTADGNDTLDVLVRVRSTGSTGLTNTYVTAQLPAGFSYITGSTTLNGSVTGDGIVGAGLNVGTVTSSTRTTVKFSVRVDAGSVPSWGTVTVNSTAQARADGTGTISANLPITLGTSASITAVAAVATGPADPVLMALFAALLMTGLYATYTRTDRFGRRMAHAEISRLTRSRGLNFSR